MKHLLSFILMKLKDQRGEAGDKDDSNTDDVLDVDDVIKDDDLEDDDVINIDPDALEDDDDDDDDPDDKGEDQRMKDLEAKLETQEKLLADQDKKLKENNRIFYGLRKKEKEAKGDDKSESLTDAQLESLIEENQDNPKAMLQIMKQVSTQTATGKAEDAVKTIELSQRKKELDGHLITTWPDANDEGSQTHADIQNAKEFLHVTDHPLGDFIGAAGKLYLELPTMLENARREERDKILKGTTEKKRKESIKENSLDTSKKKVSSKGMSADYQATAKQLKLSPSATKIMAQIVNENKKSATVEV